MECDEVVEAYLDQIRSGVPMELRYIDVPHWVIKSDLAFSRLRARITALDTGGRTLRACI
jgi:hypothetical protein